MTKMTSIQRHQLPYVRTRIDQALAALGAELGIKFAAGACRYTETSFEFKLEGALVDTTGAAQTPGRAAFARYASMYGLDPSDLGRKITIKGVDYEIVGLSPTRPKFPIDAKRVWDGKLFKLTQQAVAGLPKRAA